MTTFPDDDDGAVLASLAEAGVDLSKPLEIEFAIVATDDESAQQIAAAVRAAGYSAEVDYDAGEPEDGEAVAGDQAFEDEDEDEDDEQFGPSWTICVAIELIPEHARIVAIQAELDALAVPFGGAADGWGVLI
jgi:hypothetical protein